ncbi:MAG: hypothetical protein IJV16_06735 [Lachnospiraceae bacterium]|nr:hypothetical protein [Lachnospiraceae bacterium]MBR1523363.1 hypothetical protein [Lachnospiraceae bacterium]
MTHKKATNIIIRLRKEGWSGDKITEFIGYIETHNPTEEEFNQSSQKTKE